MKVRLRPPRRGRPEEHTQNAQDHAKGNELPPARRVTRKPCRTYLDLHATLLFATFMTMADFKQRTVIKVALPVILRYFF